MSKLLDLDAIGCDEPDLADALELSRCKMRKPEELLEASELLEDFEALLSAFFSGS